MAKSRNGGPRTPAAKTPGPDGICTIVRYTPQLAREICERLAQGEIWSQICREEGQPSYSTFYDWKRRYPEFAEQVEQSREMAADYKADRALIVAEAATPATVSADRLRVSTLQWHAAKAAPHRYGRKAEDRPAPEARRLVVYVKRFERAVRPDGTTYVREVRPEGCEDE